MSEVNLQADSKGLDAPIEREIVDDGGLENDSDLLDIDEARRYRAVAATLNYLALDRSDINYATKEICRSMSKPRKSGWANVKRLARYLVAHPRLVWRFPLLGCIFRFRLGRRQTLEEIHERRGCFD